MSEDRLLLETPALPSQNVAVSRTAAAIHGDALAELATDAAGGRLAQRATVYRSFGGVLHLFYDPRSAARLIELAVSIAWWGTYVNGDGYALELEITDGTTTILSTNTAVIPLLLQAGSGFSIALGTTGARLDAMERAVFPFDVDALAAEGLDPTVPWRFVLTGTAVGTTAVIEVVELSEVPRFVIDEADGFGAYRAPYVPRQAITESLSRVPLTLAAAYSLNRRTYHHLAVEEASALVVTSTSYAPIPGAQSEAPGTAMPWTVAPRRLDGKSPVRFGVRYRTSGAGTGGVRLTTAEGTVTLALAGTSGVWADELDGAHLLPDTTTDVITWTALISSGTMDISVFWVVDAPT